jgi:hypothetical protein
MVMIAEHQVDTKSALASRGPSGDADIASLDLWPAQRRPSCFEGVGDAGVLPAGPVWTIEQEGA